MRPFKEWWHGFVGTMGGVIALGVWTYASLHGTPNDVLLFWLGGAGTLIVCASVVIVRQHARLVQYERAGVFVAVRGTMREFLDKLTESERLGLRRLVLVRRMTGDQVRDQVPGVDFTRIAQLTPFIFVTYGLVDIGHVTDVWSVYPEWQNPLEDALVATPTWTTWPKLYRRLLKTLAVVFCKKHYWNFKPSPKEESN